MKKSLYAEYVKEKYDQDVVENDTGFVVYKISDSVCFIECIYIVKPQRRLGVATLMMRDLVEKLPPSVQYLSCEIDTSAIDGLASFAAARSFGFEILKTNGNNVVMVKYI